MRVFDPEVDAEAIREKTKRADCNLLDVAYWQVGWDRHALALAMVDMLEFSIAMQYKQVSVILEIGFVCASLFVDAGRAQHCLWGSG